MKVVLLAKIKGLGNPDDVKDVAEGYANNFLFPNHLAVLATENTIKEIKNAEKKKKVNDEKELQQIQKLIERLDGQMLVIREEPNDKGVFYAAISVERIIKTLTEYKFPGITRNQIIAPVIKEIGEFKAIIKFKHGLEAKINLSVRPLKS